MDGVVGVEAVGFCHVLSVAAVGYLDGEMVIWDVPSQRVRHTCQHKVGHFCFKIRHATHGLNCVLPQVNN
jgi:hypothetical protein